MKGAKDVNAHRVLLLSVLFIFSCITLAAGAQKALPPQKPKPKEFSVAPPPLTEGIFPCSQCHQGMPVNRTPRKMEQFHQEIELRHMPGGWCFDCHNPTDRDKFRLASGILVGFDESYKLCGQCHGPVLRDWKLGIHGKRVGQWEGEKQYYLCVNCHYPHEPKFKPIAPMPPPVRPSDIK